MLSVIIPTLNEEQYLFQLLNSIKKQNFSDYEIIVADAGSKDKTLQIAKEYNCKIVKGGMPAKGRNEGAKIAKGEFFLFLDADVILPDNFIEKTIKECKKRNIDFAGFSLIPYPKKGISLFLLNLFYNFPAVLLERILPHAAQAIIARKEIFERLNGYDETIKLAEDHDLVRRAAKISRFRMIKSTYVFFSDRRFKKDGWLITGFKYFLCELHMIFLGPVRSDIFRYKFGHYHHFSKNKK